jgi:hypothetical protein
MEQFLLKALICLACIFSQTTFAADLYRCGNDYQVTPCKKTVKNMPASKTVAPIVNKIDANEKPPIIPVDRDCKRRGNAAKKIINLREIGKTESEQLATTRSNSSQALIKEVYKHHGTAFQVRRAIERECMQQKKKPAAIKTAEKKKPSTCGSLKAGLDDIDRRRINGGAPSYLDNLQQQQIMLMKEMKAAGCFH